MSHQNLEQALKAAGNAANMLRNSQIGPYAFPVVPTEFTNWRDEQRAWQETCALFDQSHHMTDLYIEGPDVVKLISDLGINSVNNFVPNKGKQFVACNQDGFVIGDAVLFYLEENKMNLVGRPSSHNWLQYHIDQGGYDVTSVRDDRSFVNKKGQRMVYRYQVQGPHAVTVMEKVTGKPAPDISFFNMDVFIVDGCEVRAIKHGMVGQPGWEIWGPWEDGDKVRNAILEAGQEYGIRQVGSKAYSTSALVSGWIPSPVPAIYTGEEMKAYREWLPADSYEGMSSLGGSYYSDNIADYYLTPYDLGYGPFVKFDHDFVGREALEKIAAKPPRKKVTLVWNDEDVADMFKSLSHGGNAYKYFDMPLANYATMPFDKVMKDGKMTGVSTYTGYTYNERAMISLASIDIENSEPGTEVTLFWGEENRGSTKPTVERHKQKEVRAIVAPAPFAKVARDSYRPK